MQLTEFVRFFVEPTVIVSFDLTGMPPTIHLLLTLYKQTA